MKSLKIKFNQGFEVAITMHYLTAGTICKVSCNIDFITVLFYTYCTENKIWTPHGVRIILWLKYKKVLLRDRKRHTARCPGQEGYPSPVLAGGGYPSLALDRGVPQSYPGWGTMPVLSWDWHTSWPGLGYPPSQLWGTPQERTWDQRPGKEPGTGVPPGCERTDTCENITLSILWMRAV